MKQALSLWILGSVFAYNTWGQSTNYIKQSTKGINSPNIFASNVSIAFGIRPTIVLALDSIFQKENLTFDERQKKVVTLISKYRNLEVDHGNRKLSKSSLRSVFGHDVGESVIELFTEGENSPTIFATDSVNVIFGMSEEIFWGLYSFMEKKFQTISNQNFTIEDWQGIFKRIIDDFLELEKELSKRSDKMAQQARLLISQGHFDKAKKVLANRIKYADKLALRLQIFSQKQKAQTRFDYGKLLQLESKSDSAVEMFAEAVAWIPTEPEYFHYLTNLLDTLYRQDSITQHIFKFLNRSNKNRHVLV